MSKRNNHLKVLIMEYVQSIIEMADSVNTKNINQVVSLIKANVRVLENDVKNSFSRHDTQDMGYRDYN